MRGLLGKKVGMTRIFDDNGNAVPVTVLQAGPCTVTQVKTVNNDGYEAVQVGYGERKEKHLTKPLKGHFDNSGVAPNKVLAEFDTVPGFDYKVGQSFHVGLFKEGEYVDYDGLIVINEINYNPAQSFEQSDQDFEFIELYNNNLGQ